MHTAKIFMNGRSQAVRLPKEFRFEGVDEVEISREGGKIVLQAKRAKPTSWDEVFAAIKAAGGAEDFPLREPQPVSDDSDPLAPYEG